MAEIDPMYIGKEKTKKEIFKELCETDRTYPCKTCTRVKVPAECGSTACPQWQSWASRKFEGFHKIWERYHGRK